MKLSSEDKDQEKHFQTFKVFSRKLDYFEQKIKECHTLVESKASEV